MKFSAKYVFSKVSETVIEFHDLEMLDAEKIELEKVEEQLLENQDKETKELEMVEQELLDDQKKEMAEIEHLEAMEGSGAISGNKPNPSKGAKPGTSCPPARL